MYVSWQGVNVESYFFAEPPNFTSTLSQSNPMKQTIIFPNICYNSVLHVSFSHMLL